MCAHYLSATHVLVLPVQPRTICSELLARAKHSMSDSLQSLITEIRALRAKYGDDTARAALAARTSRLAPEKRARLEAVIFFNGQMGDVKIGDVTGRDVIKGVQCIASLADDARLTSAAVGVNQGTIGRPRDRPDRGTRAARAADRPGD